MMKHWFASIRALPSGARNCGPATGYAQKYAS